MPPLHKLIALTDRALTDRALTYCALTYCLSVLSVGWVTVSPGQALAQSPQLEAITIQYAAPPDLEDRHRPPGRSRGGASRGDCQTEENQPNLTALAPSTQIASSEVEPSLSQANLASYESVLSLTTGAYPSFWFYVPDPLNNSITLEFVLQNKSGDTLYQTQFMADKESLGVVQFSLPESASPLSLDEAYQWYFLTHCDVSATDDSPYVKGWIIRTPIDADFQAQLDKAAELDKAALYAAQGIWQDAVTLLGELYRADPQNTTLRNHWVSLLTSVGLDEISAEPLGNCCLASHIEQVR